jgi:hypothetical protein
MSAVVDVLTPDPVRLRHGLGHWLEDQVLLRHGILDPEGYKSHRQPQVNPVEVRTSSLVDDSVKLNWWEEVRDPILFTKPIVLPNGEVRDAAFGMQRRRLREVRRSHNLQVDLGKNQIQRIQSFGDVGAALNGGAVTGTATAPTATTWTGAASSFATAAAGSGNTGVQGKVLFVANTLAAGAFTNPVFGVIVSNTATVATVDQWYAIPMTGAVGTTPAANSAGLVLPGGSWALWVGLSTSVAAPAAADVTRTADGLWGDGTGAGAATETVVSGMTRAWVGQGGTTAPTFPATKQIALGHTWTLGTAGSLTLGKVILFNALAVAGCLPLLETLLSATATVSAVGDTLQVTWTITC